MTFGIHKLDQESIRRNNIRMIFETIYNSAATGITKPELATVSGLSLMAVSRITDFLQEQGIIVERGGENGKPGRPAKNICINRGSIVSVGAAMDIGGISLGAIGPYGQMMALETHTLPIAGYPPEQVLRNVAEIIHAFLHKHGLEETSSVGFVMPGLIDSQQGRLKLASQLRWEDVPVASMIESFAPLPSIIIENDVKARAQAEARFGSSRLYQNSVLLLIGSGIGAGIIIDKSIYRGKSNMAGEIGHTKLSLNHRMCDCGRMGCAQATISEPALMQEARKMDPDIDMEGLVAAYEEGKPWARRLLEMTADHIIMLVNMLANVYAPEAIILCGSLMDSCPILRTLITASVREEQPQFLNPTFTLGYSAFGPDGNIVGAATVAFNHNVDLLIARSPLPQDGMDMDIDPQI